MPHPGDTTSHGFLRTPLIVHRDYPAEDVGAFYTIGPYVALIFAPLDEHAEILFVGLDSVMGGRRAGAKKLCDVPIVKAHTMNGTDSCEIRLTCSFGTLYSTGALKQSVAC